MKAVRYIIVIGLLLSVVEGNIEIISKLTRDYFEYFIVKQVVVLGCWGSQTSVNFGRSVMKFDSYFNYFDIKDDLNLHEILKVDYYKLGIFLDLDCQQSEEIFNQFWKQQLRYNESYFWFIPTSKKNIPDYFYKLPLNIATEMTLAMMNNDKKSYVLYDIYNPSYRHGGKLNVTQMGTWNPQTGLNITLTEYKYRSRGNLHGLTLNLSIVLNEKPKTNYHEYLHSPIDRHMDTVHRYHFAIALHLSHTFNFTIHLSRASTWGYIVNGSFNGIIGDMVKGIVDYSATAFQFSSDRFDVVEYTVATWDAGVLFTFRHPTLDSLTNPFLKPLEKKVWYLISIFGILIWTLLYLFVKIERYLLMDPPLNTCDSHPASETALITGAAICQQGLSEGPRFYSGRVVFLTLFIWGLLLYQFYSASIVGSLLAEKPRWIKTLQDLADSELDVGMEDMPYTHNHFRTTNDPAAQDLYKKKVAVNKYRKREPYFTMAEGLQRVRKGGFAFHIDATIGYRFIEKLFTDDELCDLEEVYLFPKNVVIYPLLPKNSPFKKMMIYGLRQIVEHGLVDRLQTVWRPRKPPCPDNHNSDPIPVTLNQFSPAIFLLIFGIFLAFVVMFAEYIFNRQKYSGEKHSEIHSETISEYSVERYQDVVSERTFPLSPK